MTRFLRRALWLTIVLGSTACGLAPVDTDDARRSLDPKTVWNEVVDEAERQHVLPAGLSVDAAVAIALRSNLRLRALRESRGVAEAQLLAAGLLPDPEVDLRALASGALEATLGLDVIEALFLRARKEDAARLGIEDVDLEIAEAEWELALEVERAWYRSYYARERTRTLRSMSGAAESIAQAQRVAQDQGEESVLAVLDAESAVLELDIEAEAAGEAEVAANLALLGALGLPSSLEITLASPTREDLADDTETHAEVMRGARFDLRRALLQQRRALSELDLASGLRWSETRVGPSIESDPEEGLDPGIAIGFSLPLFSGNRGAIAEAAAHARFAAAEYVAMMFDASVELSRAQDAYRRARVRAASWRDHLLPRSRRALEFVERGVETGQISRIELWRRLGEARRRELAALDAERELDESRIALKRAIGPLTSP